MDFLLFFGVDVENLIANLRLRPGRYYLGPGQAARFAIAPAA